MRKLILNTIKRLKKTLLSIFIATILAVIMTSCDKEGVKIETVSLIPVKSGDLFQYIDLEGNIIINPQFREATIFRNGLALVQTSGENQLWGFIGKDGKYVIAPKYVQATIFRDDLAWVVSESGIPTCINTKGETIFALQNAKVVTVFSEGLAGFMEVNDIGQENYGFVDKEGKVKINAQFSSFTIFNNGKCSVSNHDGKWGYIDKEGKILINYQFDDADLFYNGIAIVQLDGKYGLIDESGKYQINPQYSFIGSDGDLFLVKQDGKYGWIDKEGKIIINPQFRNVLPFANGSLAPVAFGESYGFIDREGKIVINPQFDFAYPFNGKLALVFSSNKIGFIDKEGKYIINPQFDSISEDLRNYFIFGGSKYLFVQTDLL